VKSNIQSPNTREDHGRDNQQVLGDHGRKYDGDSFKVHGIDEQSRRKAQGHPFVNESGQGNGKADGSQTGKQYDDKKSEIIPG